MFPQFCAVSATLPSYRLNHVKVKIKQATTPTYPGVSLTAAKLRLGFGWLGPSAAANEGL